jgi:hypothetical protein
LGKRLLVFRESLVFKNSEKLLFSIILRRQQPGSGFFCFCSGERCGRACSEQLSKSASRMRRRRRNQHCCRFSPGLVLELTELADRSFFDFWQSLVTELADRSFFDFWQI